MMGNFEVQRGCFKINMGNIINIEYSWGAFKYREVVTKNT